MKVGTFTLPTTDHLLLSQSKMEEPWTIYCLITIATAHPMVWRIIILIYSDVDCRAVWLGECIIVKTLPVITLACTLTYRVMLYTCSSLGNLLLRQVKNLTCNGIIEKVNYFQCDV